MTKAHISPRMSDAAVKSKTGKTWAEWFTLLDKAGGKKLDHKALVAHLDKRHRVDPWWRQMVAVSYEQARGLRQPHGRGPGRTLERPRQIAAAGQKHQQGQQEPKEGHNSPKVPEAGGQKTGSDRASSSRG